MSNAKLREALKPFAELGFEFCSDERPPDEHIPHAIIYAGDLQRAREALASTEDDAPRPPPSTLGTDIVTFLRLSVECGNVDNVLLSDAADEIERLRSDLAATTADWETAMRLQSEAGKDADRLIQHLEEIREEAFNGMKKGDLLSLAKVYNSTVLALEPSDPGQVSEVLEIV